jgi:uncharacterized protein
MTERRDQLGRAVSEGQEEQGVTNATVANSSAAPSGPVAGAIDTDFHLYVPDGMASVAPYIPASWRQMFEMLGTVVGGDVSVPSRFHFPRGRVDAIPPSGGAPGSDAKFAQVDHLNRHGFSGVIMSSLEAGQAAQGFYGVDASSVMCSAFNDFALEQWNSVDDRFKLAMCVSSVDVDGAVAEIKRIGKHAGVAAVYVPLINIGLGNKYFYPIYAAAQAADLPIFLHITGAEFTYPGTPAWPCGTLENFSERRVAYAVLGPVILNSLVFSGVFERFPKLNFVFAEFGFSWAVGMMWRMDSTWRYARAGTPWVKRPPSDYVRERVKFGTQPIEDPSPADMAKMISLLGAECLMFSTDYPHWDYDAPGHVFASENTATKHRIYRTNAQEIFRW